MNLLQCDDILHSNNYGNATSDIAMKLKLLCSILTNGSIAGVYLRDAHAKPIIDQRGRQDVLPGSHPYTSSGLP